MITITEKKTKKVPGITSLFVSFDYNKDIIDKIKTLDCFNYSKVTKEWEIPVTFLSQLIDMLCIYDDIQLTFCKINFEEDQVYTLSKYKTKPLPHQIEGIQYGLNNNQWLLRDPPGLGKTLQAIYLAEELKKRDKIQHCLIVCCVNSLKTNWKKEIQQHSKLSCRILGEHISRTGKVTFGSIPKRLEELKKPIKEFFVIVNIETLRNKDIIKQINSGKNAFDMIVVDEIHLCKNSTTSQGSNLLHLNKAKYKIGLTGTLIINNPMDVYVPFRFVDIDRSTKTNFQNYYCNYGGPFGNEIVGYKNLDVIQKQLELFTLRRDKKLLNLPPKILIPKYIDMSDEQSKFYDDVKNGIKKDVDKVKLLPNVVLSMVLRLRQATACPSILSTKKIDSAKIDTACNLTEEIISDGSKVVIFSTFKQTVKELEERLKIYNPLIGTGDIPDNIIAKNIELFQTEDKYKIFIATWQKCGTGWTLNAANNVIFIDTPFTNSSFEQACDRLHRIGTKNTVFIYNLICSNTIDERIKEIVEDKEAISKFVEDNEITEKSLGILKKYIQELQ